MGKLITNSSKKILRYGNFTNSITTYYDDNNGGGSYIKQTFSGATYNLFCVDGGDYIDRTGRISCNYYNGRYYCDKYNLKLSSSFGYWGEGTFKYNNNYLVKEENVFPYHNKYTGIVDINIPSKWVHKLITYNDTPGIYFYVSLNSGLLGDNIYEHYYVGKDFPDDSNIIPHDDFDMVIDYEFYYDLNYDDDRNKNLMFRIMPPAKKDYRANIFIFIPDCNSVTCDITYNPGSLYSSQLSNKSFYHTEVSEIAGGLTDGMGYSLYVDGYEGRYHNGDDCGAATINVTNVS